MKNRIPAITAYTRAATAWSGTMRNSDPSDDWCNVERITPQMTNGTVIAWTAP
jgi:hypothetical protein